MDILRIYEVQLEKVREKFSDVVDSSLILRSESGEPLKLRLDMIDGSLLIDIFDGRWCRLFVSINQWVKEPMFLPFSYCQMVKSERT